jgi:hypothetical protein
MSRQEIEAWATAYIQAQQDPTLLHEGNPLWWAVEKFMMPATDSVTPEDCWAGILEVLARDPPESVKGILAAGALEDLIDQHGPKFIERIEAESKRNPAFRHLLGGVWESSTPEVWARVEKVQSPHW